VSHKEEKEFCKSVKAKFPLFFVNNKVLEIGSGDINGNNNYLFDSCSMIKVDVAYGPNVDLISYAHNLTFVDEYFDTIISTECFEHDKHYEKSILSMYRMLRSGGLMLFTCATTGRPEHGTSRSKPYQVLSTRLENYEDYYRNLTEGDIRKALDIKESFIQFEFSIDTNHHDLFFWGIKK
jgi:SAM-dependent methyltransferase